MEEKANKVKDTKLDGHLSASPQNPYSVYPACPSRDPEPRFSVLSNWPIQLCLVSTKTPIFEGARLTIVSSCVAFIFPDFHPRYLNGQPLLVSCPKQDDVNLTCQKLIQIFLQNNIKSVDVVHTEAPCCTRLVRLVRIALKKSKKEIPLLLTKVLIHEGICELSESGLENGEALI